MEKISVTGDHRITLSVEELHERTGLSKQFLRSEIKRGRLGVAKVGRRVLIPVKSVAEWLDAAMKRG